MIKAFKLTIVVSITVLAVTACAHASLMLRQPSVNLFLKQGQALNSGIVLENVSGNEITVRAELADALGQDKLPASHTCSSWIKLSEKTFTIPAGGTKELKYSLAVPVKAEGGYYTSIVYSYLSGKLEGPDATEFNVMMHIESPFEVIIRDTVKNSLKVLKMDAKQENGSFVMDAEVKNTGNSFYDLRGTFLVQKADGSLIKALKPSKFKLYPGEEKNISYRGEVNIPKGRNTVTAVFDIDENEPVIEQKVLAVE